jgi:hypothetical protein
MHKGLLLSQALHELIYMKGKGLEDSLWLVGVEGWRSDEKDFKIIFELVHRWAATFN